MAPSTNCRAGANIIQTEFLHLMRAAPLCIKAVVVVVVVVRPLEVRMGMQITRGL